MVMEKIQDPVKANSLKSVSSVEDERGKTVRIDPIEERRAVRKLDWCIIPIMSMFYFLSFLVSFG